MLSRKKTVAHFSLVENKVKINSDKMIKRLYSISSVNNLISKRKIKKKNNRHYTKINFISI